MPKYAKSKKEYPLTIEGVSSKFQTPSQRLKRIYELRAQEKYNECEIVRARSRIAEINDEIRLLLPLAETGCKCGSRCSTCISKRMEKLLKAKKEKKQIDYAGVTRTAERQ